MGVEEQGHKDLGVVEVEVVVVDGAPGEAAAQEADGQPFIESSENSVERKMKIAITAQDKVRGGSPSSNWNRTRLNRPGDERLEIRGLVKPHDARRV